MEKKFMYSTIAAVIIAIVLVSVYFASIDIEKSKGVEFKWLTSGPFSVKDYQHKLGENIFVVASGIAPNEKGTIRVYTPKNIEYVSYPFDGSVKQDFNVYFKPDTLFLKNRCSPEDLIGVWNMEFEGTSYPPIQFEFINEYIEGAENDIINLCKDTT